MMNKVPDPVFLAFGKNRVEWNAGKATIVIVLIEIRKGGRCFANCR